WRSARSSSYSLPWNRPKIWSIQKLSARGSTVNLPDSGAAPGGAVVEGSRIMKTGSSITTILFTDLVSSTELIRRHGDEGAQRIFEGHHAILSDLLSQGGGEELQWLGDGLMAAFSSTADAVRCAVAMQSSTLQSVSGERLAI